MNILQNNFLSLMFIFKLQKHWNSMKKNTNIFSGEAEPREFYEIDPAGENEEESIAGKEINAIKKMEKLLCWERKLNGTQMR